MKPPFIYTEKYKNINFLNENYCNLHIVDNNLLVVNQRSISIIKNYSNGNLMPEPEPFIEMQDYYSYEPPQIAIGIDGKIWCNIGGRMFFKNTVDDKWTETISFDIGEAQPIVTKQGNIVYSTNYQRQKQTDGIIVFNPKESSIKFVPILELGKSPNPLIEIDEQQILIANAGQPSISQKILVILDLNTNTIKDISPICNGLLPVAATNICNKIKIFFANNSFKEFNKDNFYAK